LFFPLSFLSSHQQKYFSNRTGLREGFKEGGPRFFPLPHPLGILQHEKPPSSWRGIPKNNADQQRHSSLSAGEPCFSTLVGRVRVVVDQRRICRTRTFPFLPSLCDIFFAAYFIKLLNPWRSFSFCRPLHSAPRQPTATSPLGSGEDSTPAPAAPNPGRIPPQPTNVTRGKQRNGEG